MAPTTGYKVAGSFMYKVYIGEHEHEQYSHGSGLSTSLAPHRSEDSFLKTCQDSVGQIKEIMVGSNIATFRSFIVTPDTTTGFIVTPQLPSTSFECPTRDLFSVTPVKERKAAAIMKATSAYKNSRITKLESAEQTTDTTDGSSGRIPIISRDSNPTGYANDPIMQHQSKETKQQVSWIEALSARIKEGLALIPSTPYYNSIKEKDLKIERALAKKPLYVLPPLPPEAHQLIQDALSKPASISLVERFNISISPKDLHTLVSPNWLNDEIINFYLRLVMERSEMAPVSSLPTLHVFNTFFYTKLKDGGYSSVCRWTRRIDIFSKEMVLIPVHLGMHWTLACIDFASKKISYFDSLHGTNRACLSLLIDYLGQEHLDKKGVAFDESGWSTECSKSVPAQQNGYDCGVFACVFAERFSRRAPFDFSQGDMSYYRKRLMVEILTATLLSDQNG